MTLINGTLIQKFENNIQELGEHLDALQIAKEISKRIKNKDDSAWFRLEFQASDKDGKGQHCSISTNIQKILNLIEEEIAEKEDLYLSLCKIRLIRQTSNGRT